MTDNQYNELKSLLYEILDNVSKITDKVGNELMTPSEVCELRKFSRSTYRRLVQKGIISQIRTVPGINTKVYVKRSEIERLIEEGKI